jgi:hypothetical protein
MWYSQPGNIVVPDLNLADVQARSLCVTATHDAKENASQ